MIFSEKQIDPFEDKVKCDECKCWLDKSDARAVIFRSPHGYGDDKKWYCAAHKKPYTRYDLSMGFPFSDTPARFRYFAEVEVTREGTPVGYVKVEKQTGTKMRQKKIPSLTCSKCHKTFKYRRAHNKKCAGRGVELPVK